MDKIIFEPTPQPKQLTVEETIAEIVQTLRMIDQWDRNIAFRQKQVKEMREKVIRWYQSLPEFEKYLLDLKIKEKK